MLISVERTNQAVCINLSDQGRSYKGRIPIHLTLSTAGELSYILFNFGLPQLSAYIVYAFALTSLGTSVKLIKFCLIHITSI